MRRRFVTLLIFCLFALSAKSQSVALKTNVLSDAFMNVNLGLEVGLDSRWSLDVSGQLNDWTLSHERMWKHWAVQPEARYWFCSRLSGHFIGVHLFTGQYNIGGIGKDFRLLGTDYSSPLSSRYQGWIGGAGVGYGYAWILGWHWNVEAELGVGYAYMTYDRFSRSGCGKFTGSGDHNYFGLTKAAVNLVYVF